MKTLIRILPLMLGIMLFFTQCKKDNENISDNKLPLPEEINFKLILFSELDNPKSYFQTTIYDGFLEGIYEGWCLDSHTIILPNTDHFGKAYSSQDRNMPLLFDYQENLSLVNWIINHDFVGKESPGGYGKYTLGDVTNSLWILLEETSNPNPSGGVGPFSPDRVNEIVEMAFDKGDGYISVCGRFLAVIIVAPGKQTTMIKYKLLCD